MDMADLRICPGQNPLSARIIRPKRNERSVKTVRSVLNGLRWRPDCDFGLVDVEYIHRGGPGDIASVRGSDILSLEPWMMVIGRDAGRGGPVPGRAAIPYHRIVRVRYGGKTVFDRTGKKQAGQDSEFEAEPGEKEAWQD
jgi:uncharacterized protein (UPF0248 family)